MTLQINAMELTRHRVNRLLRRKGYREIQPEEADLFNRLEAIGCGDYELADAMICNRWLTVPLSQPIK